MPLFRSILKPLAAAGAAVLLSTAALAQQMPPVIKLVVGYPPGGSVDILARLLVKSMQESLKTSIYVDNRPGAGGRIAAAQIKNGPADGSLIMLAPNGLTTVQTLVYANKLDYNMLTDFTAVSKLAAYPMSLAVPGSSPIKTASDLKNWIKAHPDQATFGSSAAGGTAHFSGLLFAKAAGIEWTHVPYKGGAPLITDLAGGHISAGVDTLIDQIEQHRSGKIRVVGIFSPKRYTLAPDIPTLEEGGVKGLNVEGWFGAFVSSKVPAPVTARIDAAIAKALAEPEIKTKLNQLMVEVSYLPTAEFSKLQAQELKEWAPIVRDSGFTPD